jgi:hypothetical protein
MSLFGFKVCLATDVKGNVTLQGKPVANAKVIREVKFQDKSRKDETITDENGNFAFSVVYDRTISKYTPFEVVIGQEINIEYDNKIYLALRTSKRNFDYGGELNAPSVIKKGDGLIPFVLRCELSNEPKIRSSLGNDMATLSGICLIPGEN